MNKKWYTSKLIWGGVAMAVAGVYRALTGGDDSLDTDALMQAVEGVSVIVLRLVTTKQLTK
jgi:hypothetical protein